MMTPIVENQMEKSMEHEVATVFISTGLPKIGGTVAVS